MNAPRHWTRGALVLAIALAAGCGKDRVMPPGSNAQLPPQVIDVFPASLSIHVPYDLTELWVRFAEDLDSTTVIPSNVFLKRDTRRSDVEVRWDAATRRILIHPVVPLELAETYTVELKPQITTASGVALGATYWWQFTLSGIRRLARPFPPPSDVPASPYTPLTWDRTESSAGTVVYDLYIATDSAAVAQRSVAPISRSRADYERNSSWGMGQRYFWAITARNTTLGEQEEGPVWSFDTVPPGAPVDSVRILADFYGFYEARISRSTCMDTRLIYGSQAQGAVSWNLAARRPEMRIAAARIVMGLTVGTIPPPSTILSTRIPIGPDCSLSGLPTAGLDALASNLNVGGVNFYYASDALTAHFAAIHHGLTSANGFTFATSGNATGTYGVPPVLVLTYYR